MRNPLLRVLFCMFGVHDGTMVWSVPSCALALVWAGRTESAVRLLCILARKREDEGGRRHCCSTSMYDGATPFPTVETNFGVTAAASSRAVVPDAASLCSVHTHHDVHRGPAQCLCPTLSPSKKKRTSNRKRDGTQSNLSHTCRRN